MRYATRSTDHPSFPALPLRESCHVAWIGVLLSRFWPKQCHCVCCTVSVRWRRAQVVVCQHIGQNYFIFTAQPFRCHSYILAAIQLHCRDAVFPCCLIVSSQL